MATCKKEEVTSSVYIVQMTEEEAEHLQTVLFTVADDLTDRIFDALDIAGASASSDECITHFRDGRVWCNDLTIKKVSEVEA